MIYKVLQDKNICVYSRKITLWKPCLVRAYVHGGEWRPKTFGKENT